MTLPAKRQLEAALASHGGREEPTITNTSAARIWRVRGWVRALALAMPILFLAPIAAEAPWRRRRIVEKLMDGTMSRRLGLRIWTS